MTEISWGCSVDENSLNYRSHNVTNVRFTIGIDVYVSAFTAIVGIYTIVSSGHRYNPQYDRKNPPNDCSVDIENKALIGIQND
uniref:Uncharacterized protein n=1 Tax=Glossina palpalis gambiensis TaxID=67801 RepID=A0A1B0ALT5_9MUSC